jgi:phosphoglycerate dehydrogenase-like enzyme
MCKIFIAYDNVLQDVLENINKRLLYKGYEVIYDNNGSSLESNIYSKEVWNNFFLDSDVLIVSSRVVLDRELLKYARRCRGVVFPTIGYNSCDIEAAEATVMLISALLLELPWKINHFRSNLSRPSSSQFSSRMLSGKKIGFLGFGRIAEQTVKRLQGWQYSEILAHTRSPKHTCSGVRYVSIEELFSESDIVSINVPLSSTTRNLVDWPLLSIMKTGSLIVNTSRGGILNEDALCRALKNKILAGAAIDVFEVEPYPPGQPLRQFDNVILTQHMIGHTREMFDSFAPASVENVVSIIEGRLPKYICNPQVSDLWNLKYKNSNH